MQKAHAPIVTKYNTTIAHPVHISYMLYKFSYEFSTGMRFEDSFGFFWGEREEEGGVHFQE